MHRQTARQQEKSNARRELTTGPWMGTIMAPKDIKSNFISREPTVEENPTKSASGTPMAVDKDQGQVATSNTKRMLCMLGGLVVLAPHASLDLQILPSFKGHSCCHSGCSVCSGGCRVGYKINSNVMLWNTWASSSISSCQHISALSNIMIILEPPQKKMCWNSSSLTVS